MRESGRSRFTVLAILSVVVAGAWSLKRADAQETPEQRYVIGVERIWDRPGHAAFTDLLKANDALYCAFREGSGHIPGLNGLVRVLRSRDGSAWHSVALLAEEHVDLRDPKLSPAPDGRIVVNMGASYYEGSKRLKIESRVAFSDSTGETFGPPMRVEFPPDLITGGDWLWRLTWHDRAAWGCVQQVSRDKSDRALWLLKSDDAIHYQAVSQLKVDSPSETTLRFLPDGRLVAMIRTEGAAPVGIIGTSTVPYTDWKFNKTDRQFGGPNFVPLPGGRFLAGSRRYESKAPQTELWWLDPSTAKIRDLLVLPSRGDSSYPGFVVDEPSGKVYVSYYSSHEGKAAIYLATLRLGSLTAPGEK